MRVGPSEHDGRGLQVIPVPCLRDNYAYLVADRAEGTAAVVDPSEAGPVLRALRQEGLRPVAVWATHHHFDHVGGIEGLLQAVGALAVLGSRYDAEQGRIPCQSEALRDGQCFAFGRWEVRALHVPGHTLGAVAYLVDGNLLTGDTLFLAGCGRLFEGDPTLMVASLRKLRALPPRTRLWCGHEYTLANLRFAAHAEPDNPVVHERLERVRALRAQGLPTVPGTLAEECETNPFLRFDRADAHFAIPGADASADPVARFAALRRAKDGFRG